MDKKTLKTNGKGSKKTNTKKPTRVVGRERKENPQAKVGGPVNKGGAPLKTNGKGSKKTNTKKHTRVVGRERKEKPQTKVGGPVNKGGAPLKLTNEWILMADDVLKGDKETITITDEETGMQTDKEVTKNQFRAIMLNDEDLVEAINDRMEEINEHGKVFTYRTFQRYKRHFKNKEKQTEEDIALYGKLNDDQEQLFEKFCRLIKKHLRKQKEILFQSLAEDKAQRQRWAWIIERKFDDWNIRHKVDQTNHDIDENNITTEEQEKIMARLGSIKSSD